MALWHIRPLINSLSYSFPHHWTPSQVLVVDESLVPCKARSKIKQYLKDKHKRWGYKIWCLVSKKYLFRFEVYTGKWHSKSTESTASVVEKLVSPYYGLNHLVVMNNYFASIPLFQSLLSDSTYALGTFRPNRKGFPSDMVSEIKQFNRGNHSFRQNGQLITYSFLDRQPVYFLSSFHSSKQMASLSRVGKGGQQLTFPVPTAIRDYNSYRGGVDVLDQLHSYYSISRKSRRWWPRLPWWLIDAAICNAHRLYQVRINGKCSGLDFRMKLMHELAGDTNQDNKNKNKTSQPIIINDLTNHWIIYSDSTLDCVHCSEQKKLRKRSHFKCFQCDKHLCIGECFASYHKYI